MNKPLRKKPDPVDVHVGARLRMRRVFLGMSQEKLADHLGLTFQQIQKYEKGANRIGASRLYAISRVLDTPVQYFFDDLPAEAGAGGEKPSSAPGSEDIAGFVASAEGLQLNMAFARIRDTATRRRLADLVRTLAEEDAA